MPWSALQQSRFGFGILIYRPIIRHGPIHVKEIGPPALESSSLPVSFTRKLSFTNEGTLQKMISRGYRYEAQCRRIFAHLDICIT